jgi:putative flippase GtrA
VQTKSAKILLSFIIPFHNEYILAALSQRNLCSESSGMNAAKTTSQNTRSGVLGLIDRVIADGRASSFIRFAGIGVFATLIHGLALNLLVLGAGLQPTLANVGAFLSAFSISYLGHYYVSFRSRQSHIAAAPKFFATALVGLTFNTVVFAIIVNLLQLHYMVAFAAVIVTLPPIMFLISRKYVFAPGEEGARGEAPTEL